MIPALLALCCLAPGQAPPPPPPLPPPPVIVEVQPSPETTNSDEKAARTVVPSLSLLIVIDGQIIQQTVQMKVVHQPKKVLVDQIHDGKKVYVPKTITERVTIPLLTQTPLDPKQARFSTVAGKKLSYEEAKKMIGEKRACLVVVGTTQLDEEYLKPFKEDTLILTLPVPAPAAESTHFEDVEPPATKPPQLPRKK